jgi:hypothetical protein
LTTETLPAAVAPGQTAVAHLPRVDFSAASAGQLLLGQRVTIQEGSPALSLGEASPARAYGPGNHFLGIVIAREADWQPHKMFPVESGDAP